MDPNTKVFPPYRLVAEYGDGSRLLFNGLTEQQAMDALEAGPGPARGYSLVRRRNGSALRARCLPRPGPAAARH